MTRIKKLEALSQTERKNIFREFLKKYFDDVQLEEAINEYNRLDFSTLCENQQKEIRLTSSKMGISLNE